MSSDDLAEIERQLSADIAAAADLTALEAVRVAALGKKGVISQKLKTLGGMSAEERQLMGPALNGLKARIGDALAARKAALEQQALDARLAAERVDVSLPAPPLQEGSVHPVSQVIDEITEIFADMGFGVAEGPEIEDDFHNFTALNFPPGHPARDMHDTFFFGADASGVRKLLRTHTSTVQIRTMTTVKPPIRVIIPGRTYRCDSDATHTPQFHQVEGLVIDRATHMGHLKGTLEAFAKAFFEVDNVKMRLRPSYFPFTEPSAEMDIGCAWDRGQLKIGEGASWLEILGCGMVHPNVIRNCGLDPDIYQGFAFGAGIDRLAMLKYGMTDLRPFFEADLRWLKHYGFRPLDLPSLAAGVGA